LFEFHALYNLPKLVNAGASLTSIQLLRPLIRDFRLWNIVHHKANWSHPGVGPKKASIRRAAFFVVKSVLNTKFKHVE